MSIKELGRLEGRLDELKKFHNKRQTAEQVASNLNLSVRQVLRLSKSLKTNEAKGLVSKKVGAMRNHQLPESTKTEAISLIRERYGDFGPTLAH